MMDKSEIKEVEVVLQRDEKEVRKILEHIRKQRNKVYEDGKSGWYKYGMDGLIEIWRKRYVYRGIPYEIACLKYFSFNQEDPLESGMNRIGMHCVLEYTQEFKEVHDLLEERGVYDNWLWEDTLHAGQEDWSLEQMIDWLHDVAKRDIDFLLDEAIRELVKKIYDDLSRVKDICSLVNECIAVRRWRWI